MTIYVKFKLYNIFVKNQRGKVMTILNYIEKQKERIRDRHTGDTYIIFGGEKAPVYRSARDILAEIDSLDGLNLNERAAAGRRYDAVC